MLDPEFKKKWVEALRSGDFPQGRNVLKSPEGYCCLGVACEISGLKFNDDLRFGITHLNPDIGCYKLPSGDFALPPTEVTLEWGLSDNIGCIPVTNHGKVRKILDENGYSEIRDYALAHLNDKRVPFNIIADVIEQCL